MNIQQRKNYLNLKRTSETTETKYLTKIYVKMENDNNLKILANLTLLNLQYDAY